MHDHSSKSSDGFDTDPLSELLRGLRLDGVQYGRCVMDAPWGVDVPAEPVARLYLIGRGEAFIHTDGVWCLLGCGDAVLLPRSAPHQIASAPGAPTRPFDGYKVTPVCENVFDMQCDGTGARAVLFSASMRFNLDDAHPLLALMPDLMHAHSLNAEEPAVPHLLDAMVREVREVRVGSAGVLARLADVLAATLVRAWVDKGCGSTRGWIAAVRDPQIGRVLAAIHAEPGQDWTVERLARIAGVSRSGFALRFAELVGETPAHYVTRTRMHQARQWFVRDRAAIAAVATRLGYESEASFSRAFKRVIGVPPSRFRDQSVAAA